MDVKGAVLDDNMTGPPFFRVEHGRIRAVVGGTHLGMGAPISRVEATMDFPEEVLPDKIIVNHCTGSVVMSRMLDRFAERFIGGQTGLVASL